MDWFRVYHDIIDDPKMLALSRAQRWHVVELLAVSSRQTLRGTLPNMKIISIHLRLSLRETEKLIEFMIANGFVDTNSDGSRLSMHGWDKRQFKSDDVSARSKESMRRSREHPREQPVNVHLAGARSETDTETEKKPPNPLSGELVFILPTWIPERDWNDWIASRKKKPTVRAKELAVEKLAKLKVEGHDPATVLQQSILGSWTGLFAVKTDESAKKNGHANSYTPAPLKYLNGTGGYHAGDC